MYWRPFVLLAVALFLAGTAVACGDDDEPGNPLEEVRREVNEVLPDIDVDDVRDADVEGEVLVLETEWNDDHDRAAAASLCDTAADMQIENEPFSRVVVQSSTGTQLAECTP